MSLNATMIRERVIIQDPALGKSGSRILSNRLVLPISGELLVVRGQNMHSASRFAGRLYKKALDEGGILAAVRKEEDVAEVWAKVYEEAALASPADNWGSVYVSGNPIFASSPQHPFLDAIEKQVSNNENNYDLNVMLASETFTAAGHPNMRIDHSTNVALILNVTDDQARMGLIYRHPRRTTTFSFTALPNLGRTIKTSSLLEEVPLVLEVSADFLESIQICFALAADGAKGIDQNFEKQDTLKYRLGDLRKSIDGFESELKVSYRPERPDMNRFLLETQQLLQRRTG